MLGVFLSSNALINHHGLRPEKARQVLLQLGLARLAGRRKSMMLTEIFKGRGFPEQRILAPAQDGRRWGRFSKLLAFRASLTRAHELMACEACGPRLMGPEPMGLDPGSGPAPWSGSWHRAWDLGPNSKTLSLKMNVRLGLAP